MIQVLFQFILIWCIYCGKCHTFPIKGKIVPHRIILAIAADPAGQRISGTCHISRRRKYDGRTIRNGISGLGILRLFVC